MLFNSLQFLLFFPLVASVYYLLPFRFRWLVLLLAGVGFYLSFVPWFSAVLGGIIIFDYFLAKKIEKSSPAGKKHLLWTGLIFNLLILIFFKYMNFLSQSIEPLARLIHWNYPLTCLEILLPVGLSFYIFQSISYLIEVQRGKMPAESHFGMLSLYFLFFPKLIAGPIERPQNLLPQFKQPQVFSYAGVTDGLKQMLWGLFKKIVIADRLGLLVADLFQQPENYHGFSILLGSILLGIQIYADFSGYSDMAIGAARVFGIRLLPNFERPYFSTSMQDFWHRWHISLSTWLRDYLFLPVAWQVNRKLKKERYWGLRTDKWIYLYATAVTMVLCGLWHGASWNFVIWGALHAVFLSVGFLLKRKKRKLPAVCKTLRQILKGLVVFLAVSLAWIFFRAETLQDALQLYSHLFRSADNWWDTSFLHQTEGWRISLYLLLLLILLEALPSGNTLWESLNNRQWWVRWPVYIGFVWLILVFGHFGQQEFIYFQF